MHGDASLPKWRMRYRQRRSPGTVSQSEGGRASGIASAWTRAVDSVRRDINPIACRRPIVLYTDGLIEARNCSGELFSFGRLEALLATGANANQASEAAQRFGQDDDITVLTFTRDRGYMQHANCFSTAHSSQIS
jgi:hypothetical protein